MDIWFLRDPERLARERQAINDLEASADWLEWTRWLLADALGLEAAINAHGHLYHVRLTYPAIFPFAPPSIRPAEAGVRWSGHQYGDGTFCLEWGPDNWHPDVTAAHILESAYRLLEIENPLGAGVGKVAPSRHALTQGQELRSHYGVLTPPPASSTTCVRCRP